MNIKPLEFEGLFLRSKVPIPFVEENFYLPEKIFIDGYFPVGTIFKFQEPVCSKKIDAYNSTREVNHYCHAVSLLYSNKFNGADDSEDEYTIIFHVDLSALFLLTEPLDKNRNVIEL